MPPKLLIAYLLFAIGITITVGLLAGSVDDLLEGWDFYDGE